MHIKYSLPHMHMLLNTHTHIYVCMKTKKDQKTFKGGCRDV